MRVHNVGGATHLWTKFTVPSIGSMIQVGRSVSSTRSPAATDSSPMNLRSQVQYYLPANFLPAVTRQTLKQFTTWASNLNPVCVTGPSPEFMLDSLVDCDTMKQNKDSVTVELNRTCAEDTGS